MHIVGIIILLVILYNAWDYLFYVIGGIFGLLGLLSIWMAKDWNDEQKLSDEQWHAKYPDKNERGGSPFFALVLSMIFLGICGLSLKYQTESWHNPTLIAQEAAEKQKKLQEEEQAKIEKEQAEIEKKLQENLERANNLSGEEKNLYDTKFQEYLNAGNDENSSREKSLADVDEMIQQKQKAEQERLEAERKAREAEEKAQRLAQAEQEKIARWGNKADVKEYLEKTQPFAVTDFIQSQAGITGPLANGEVKALATHAFFMDAMAQRASKDIPKYGEIARQVAIYFDCESKIAQFYYQLKKDNKNTLDKVVGVIGTGAQTPDAYKQQSAAEDEIEAAAKWCGADLSSFYEQEAIKLFLKSLKK